MRKSTIVLELLLLSVCLSAGCATASTNLLPGLTIREDDEQLYGKLVFLFRHDANAYTNSEMAASLYEFDIRNMLLKKLAECPQGLLVASHEGDDACVIYRPGNWYRSDDTNVFVYSAGQSRTISLSAPPKATVPLARHFFFQIDEQDHTNKTASMRLLDYDFARNGKKYVKLSDSSGWQYQDYDHIHSSQRAPYALHFQYRAYGKRLVDGRDYPSGFCSLDVQSGVIRWLSKVDDDDPTVGVFKDADGQYIFFDGSDGPFFGVRLVASRYNFFDLQVDAARRKDLVKLHTFSLLPAAMRGDYSLEQLSPDRRYALVRLRETAAPKADELQPWVNTYYLVDLQNGKTRVWIKDSVQKETRGSLSQIYWVRK
jgi:hypothetical protein